MSVIYDYVYSTGAGGRAMKKSCFLANWVSIAFKELASISNVLQSILQISI